MLSSSFALVAQRIELPRPKGEMWVRFLPGAPKRKARLCAWFFVLVKGIEAVLR